MTKTVKIPKDDHVLGEAKIGGYDDLWLDNISQGGDTMTSEDVSDFIMEMHPKNAPEVLYVVTNLTMEKMAASINNLAQAKQNKIKETCLVVMTWQTVP